VEEIIDRGHGECRGHTALFTALCRAANIPARPVWGLARLPPSEKKPGGDLASHSWSEVYIAGAGWVPADPQTPESFGWLPTNCIRVFMDERKTKTSRENLPLFNLVSMNGDTIKYEVGP